MSVRRQAAERLSGDIYPSPPAISGQSCRPYLRAVGPIFSRRSIRPSSTPRLGATGVYYAPRSARITKATPLVGGNPSIASKAQSRGQSAQLAPRR